MWANAGGTAFALRQTSPRCYIASPVHIATGVRVILGRGSYRHAPALPVVVAVASGECDTVCGYIVVSNCLYYYFKFEGFCE